MKSRPIRPLALAVALALQVSTLVPACSSTQSRVERPEIHEAAVAALVVGELSVRVVDDFARAWRASVRAPMNVDVIAADSAKKSVAEARRELVAAQGEVDGGGFALEHVARVSELMRNTVGDLEALGATAPREVKRSLAFLDDYVGTRK